MERLTSNVRESKNISKGSVYYTSHKYKMQYTILNGLGDFVLNLNFVEKDMHDVFNAVTRYLDKDQPNVLQVSVLKSCFRLKNLNLRNLFFRKNLKIFF